MQLVESRLKQEIVFGINHYGHKMGNGVEIARLNSERRVRGWHNVGRKCWWPG